MNVLKLFILGSLFAFVFNGCGSKQISVIKGDRLVVQEDLPRQSAETLWNDSYTDGFTALIPKGTILEVLFTPNVGGKVIECIPVEIMGKRDTDAVEAFIVPEHIRTKEGYKSYSFSIQKEYLGTKVIVLK